MITSIIGLIKDCCQGTQSVPPSGELKNVVSLQFQVLSPVEKWSLIQNIDREFSHKNSDPNKVALFKKALCLGESKGWKNNLLEIPYKVEIDLSHQPLQYSNSLDFPLNTNEKRLVFFSDQQTCSAIGSSFATNKPELIKTDHHILDGLFASSFPEKNGRGFSLALADGARGHFGDLYQDKRIALAAHLGTKTAARLFSAYRTPEELYNEIPKVVTGIAAEIRRKTGGEGATLVACRVFSTEEGYLVL
jgi:hypothetical protein